MIFLEHTEPETQEGFRLVYYLETRGVSSFLRMETLGREARANDYRAKQQLFKSLSDSITFTFLSDIANT